MFGCNPSQGDKFYFCHNIWHDELTTSLPALSKGPCMGHRLAPNTNAKLSMSPSRNSYQSHELEPQPQPLVWTPGPSLIQPPPLFQTSWHYAAQHPCHTLTACPFSEHATTRPPLFFTWRRVRGLLTSCHVPRGYQDHAERSLEVGLDQRWTDTCECFHVIVRVSGCI